MQSYNSHILLYNVKDIYKYRTLYASFTLSDDIFREQNCYEHLIVWEESGSGFPGFTFYNKRLSL